MDAVLPFRTMAYNNAWANHRLLGACEHLRQGEFRAPGTSFFPSLSLTLNHNLTIDWFYVDALEGGSLGPAAWATAEPFPEATALRLAQAKVDRRLIAVVEALDDAALDRVVAVHRASHVEHERMDRLLLHLFQHQIHHRGQAHALLAGTSLKPPQLDEFFPEAEAPLRADEFAVLGFDEAAIWRRG